MSQRTPQYDFYATPTPAAPTQPGTPVRQAAPAPSVPQQPSAPVFGAGPVNQFGTPLGTPGASYAGAPPAGPVQALPAPSLVTRVASVPRWVWRLVLPLTVMLVLGLFGVGRLGFLDVVHHDPELPRTLAGQPLVLSSAENPDAADRLFEEDMTGATWAHYSGTRTLTVVLSPVEVSDAELAADLGDGFGAGVRTGSSWCSAHPTSGWAWCARSVDGVTVDVNERTTDLAALASVVDELVASLG